MSKRSLGEVVVISLLLLMSITQASVICLKGDEILKGTQHFRKPEILGFENGNPYIRNRDKTPITITEILIRNFPCPQFSQRGTLGIIELKINNCIFDSGVLRNNGRVIDIWEDVTIQRDNFVVTKNLYIETI